MTHQDIEGAVTHVLVLVTAGTIAWLLTPIVIRLGRRLGFLDRPGPRKVHAAAIPHCGGVVVFLAVTVSLTLARTLIPTTADLRLWPPALLGGTVIFALGVWDDLQPRPPFVKLGFQCVSAVIALSLGLRISHVALGGIPVELGVFAWPITLLWIVGLTNAFNLVDGLDGLVSGLAMIAAGACALVASTRNDLGGALLLMAILGALGGFLPYNVHPARIFLGDNGSLLVGYLLAVSAVSGSQQGDTAIAATVPLLIFAFPIVDTLWSIARRTHINGMRHVFDPDQYHIHHWLLALGLSQPRAVLLLCALSLVFAACALASTQL